MNNVYTIQDLVKTTGRNRFTIRYHVKKMKLGTMIGGITVLNKNEHDKIKKAIDSTRDHYDQVSDKLKEKND